MKAMSCIARWRTIHRIADNGMSECGSMATDLVCSSCLECPFHQACCAVNAPGAMSEACK